MKTEYKFTDAQKARIKQINEQIFELNMELANICAMTPVRHITEHPDEVDSVLQWERYRQAVLHDQPLIKPGAIVKMIFDEVNDNDGRKEKAGGREP